MKFDQVTCIALSLLCMDYPLSINITAASRIKNAHQLFEFQIGNAVFVKQKKSVFKTLNYLNVPRECKRCAFGRLATL